MAASERDVRWRITVGDDGDGDVAGCKDDVGGGDGAGGEEEGGGGRSTSGGRCDEMECGDGGR